MAVRMPVIIGTLGMLLLAACAGVELRTAADRIDQQLVKVRADGVQQCEPEALAVAEANLEFARVELEQGNAVRADEHLAIAQREASRLVSVSERCKPPAVVKIEIKDTDRDGFLDPADGCPTEPEDKDGFEDEDGCPDLDNDGDGLPDKADRCPDEAGPATNKGCPVQDADLDGIKDDVDNCPKEAEDVDGFEDLDGCPDLDNDKDDLPDNLDRCPNEPGPAKNKGCPEYDMDGDGIKDKADRCPKEPEDKDGYEDADGCPDPDNDADGLLDADDRCPKVPEDKDGFEDQDGCPDPDNDADGVVDVDDRCPDEPGVAEEQGCPKKFQLVVLRKDKIEIREQVHFATGKHRILDDSFDLLGQVAQVLRDNPGIKVRIEGHTDNVGKPKTNLDLSQNRAAAVRKFLIVAGVGADRMEAKGYGQEKPIAENKTEPGRAKNRRVEFNITEH